MLSLAMVRTPSRTGNYEQKPKETPSMEGPSREYGELHSTRRTRRGIRLHLVKVCKDILIPFGELLELDHCGLEQSLL